MKILILGAGKMGSFFTDLLSFEHEVAVYDIDPMKMRFLYNTQRFTTMEEIETFRPDLVINAVSLKYTIEVFRQVLPHLPKEGPTFANLGKLNDENAIIINEGDYMGRCFFKDLYAQLGLHICEYSFDEHDRTVAYSLSIPFISTFAFAAVMKHQDAPGTTFKRHMKIAKGVLSEDDTLLREILFNPYTKDQVAQIRSEMKEIIEIIDTKDEDRMQRFLTKIRANIK